MLTEPDPDPLADDEADPDSETVVLKLPPGLAVAVIESVSVGAVEPVTLLVLLREVVADRLAAAVALEPGLSVAEPETDALRLGLAVGLRVPTLEAEGDPEVELQAVAVVAALALASADSLADTVGLPDTVRVPLELPDELPEPVLLREAEMDRVGEPLPVEDALTVAVRETLAELVLLRLGVTVVMNVRVGVEVVERELDTETVLVRVDVKLRVAVLDTVELIVRLEVGELLEDTLLVRVPV